MPRASKSFWRIEPRRAVDFVTEEWGLKAMALVLAFLLWTVVQAEETNSVLVENIEVEIVNRDIGRWEWVPPPEPATVAALVSGPSRELLRVVVGRPRIIVTIEEVEDSTMLVQLQRSWVSLASQTENVLVESIRPPATMLHFERVITQLIPLTVQLTGAPVPGFEQEGPATIEPAAVRVSGPRSKLAGLDTIRLPPLDLSGRSATDTQFVVVDPPAPNVIVAPSQVQVIIPIGPIGEGTRQRGRPPAPPSGGG